MAAEGEERLLTLFGDVHYWFSAPTPRPASHRFDKESYIYLYRDTAQWRGRLEIANHAGTPEQDAFTGYLDNSKLSQASRHPNLVTIVVDGTKGENAGAVQSSDWRLPSTDPRDEGKYLFRLHTLDIYFWTKEDASLFVRSARATLRQEQLDVDFPVPTPHAEMMSPVVQQLENVAVSDPAYQNGKTRNSATTTSQAVAGSQEGEREKVNYTPLAYNPAAPPAPEKRAHREKTPPPPDAAGGTGLMDATYEDMHPQRQQRQQQYQVHSPVASGAIPPPPSSSTTPGQPSSQPHYPSAASVGPVVGATTAAAATFGQYSSVSPSRSSISSPPISHPPSTAPSTAPTHHSYIPSSAGPQPAHSAIQNQSHPQFAQQALDSPTSQIIGRSYLTSPTQPLQHLQPHYADYLGQQQLQRPAPPPGGYSDYNHAQSQHSQAAYGGHPASPYYGTGDHDVHSQVYRPTEEEAGGKPQKEGKGGKQGRSGKEEEPGRWEQKAEKAEKGINRFLRKVEKKIG